MPAKKPEPRSQSAAERRSAETQLSTLLEKIAPEQQRLAGALRQAIRKRLPTAHEIVYEYADNVTVSYSPSDKGYAGVLALRISADGVKLYFNNGKGMPDPEKLLKGTAKLVRWIPVESASTFTRPAVMDLIDEALARNTTPFAKTGDGPVVIRPKSAK